MHPLSISWEIPTTTQIFYSTTLGLPNTISLRQAVRTPILGSTPIQNRRTLLLTISSFQRRLRNVHNVLRGIYHHFSMAVQYTRGENCETSYISSQHWTDESSSQGTFVVATQPDSRAHPIHSLRTLYRPNLIRRSKHWVSKHLGTSQIASFSSRHNESPSYPSHPLLHSC